MINECENKAKDCSAVYWLTLLLQECPWLHAHEDSSDERGSLHPRPVQQPFLLHTRDDPALLPQQAAHQGRRTHVPALPRHRPAPLTLTIETPLSLLPGHNMGGCIFVTKWLYSKPHFFFCDGTTCGRQSLVFPLSEGWWCFPPHCGIDHSKKLQCQW